MLKVPQQARDLTGAVPDYQLAGTHIPTATCSPSASMRLLQMVLLGPQGDFTGNRVVSFRRKNLPTRLSFGDITSAEEFCLVGQGQELGGQSPGDARRLQQAGAELKCHSCPLSSMADVEKLSPCPSLSPGTEKRPSLAKWKLGSQMCWVVLQHISIVSKERGLAAKFRRDH